MAYKSFLTIGRDLPPTKVVSYHPYEDNSY